MYVYIYIYIYLHIIHTNAYTRTEGEVHPDRRSGVDGPEALISVHIIYYRI